MIWHHLQDLAVAIFALVFFLRAGYWKTRTQIAEKEYADLETKFMENDATRGQVTNVELSGAAASSPRPTRTPG